MPATTILPKTFVFYFQIHIYHTENATNFLTKSHLNVPQLSPVYPSTPQILSFSMQINVKDWETIPSSIHNLDEVARDARALPASLTINLKLNYA